MYSDILRQQPTHAGALHLLGVARQQEGDFSGAADCIGRAIAIDGSEAVYHNNLGVVLRAQGQLAEATAAYRRALEINSRYPDAMSNLAAVLHEHGQHDEALALFREVLTLQPAHVDALYNLGNLCQDMGRTNEAIDCYQKAAAVQSQRADIYNNLGNALLADRRYAEAADSYERAIGLNPTCAEAHLNLGTALAEQGEIDEATRCYQQATLLRPERRLWKFRAAGLCPVVFSSAEELDRYRSDLASRLDSHLSEPLDADWRELASEGFAPSFQLCHHGRNNRQLMAKFAALFEPSFPKTKPTLGAGKPRIGFVVTRHHEAGFLRDMAGVVEHLDRSRFDVVVLCSEAGQTPCRAAIRRPETQWTPLPARLGPAVDQIVAARCDVIYHWQIGTDPLNYFLPFAPLAPIQCTGWGSHGTTGIPTVDYYLSSGLIEPEDAEEHFTESLIRFKSLTSFQRRMPPPAASVRSDFGLPACGRLYIYPGRLGKLHPESDPLLAAVLQADAEGFLILLQGRHPQPASELRRRFERTLAGVHDRVVILPAQSPADYRRLLSLADVFLDSPHYSAGFTAYDAFSLGLPIVTLPDGFGIGNYVRGMYRKMGLEHLVSRTPEQYVNQAARLGTDRAYRDSVRALIGGRSDVLFEDLNAVRECEQFFENAIACAKARTTARGLAPAVAPAPEGRMRETGESEMVSPRALSRTLPGDRSHGDLVRTPQDEVVEVEIERTQFRQEAPQAPHLDVRAFGDPRAAVHHHHRGQQGERR